jgi:hypothetical protein
METSRDDWTEPDAMSTTTTIEVTDWADLRALPRAMDALEAQLGDVVRHARRWVCNRDGFEPSPACLLRPLAELMDQLDAAFAGAGRRFAEQWQEVRDGLVVAATDVADADVEAARRMPVVPMAALR